MIQVIRFIVTVMFLFVGQVHAEPATKNTAPVKRKPAQAEPTDEQKSKALSELLKKNEEFWARSWVDRQGVGKFGAKRETWIKGNIIETEKNLARRRIQLRKFNIHDAYAAGDFPKLPPGRTCNPDKQSADRKYRTADGACNDLKYPASGMPGVRFGRLVPINKTARPSNEELLTPNPRTVSRELLAQKPGEGQKTVPFLNVLTAAWIQFMVHDWLDHGANDPNPEHNINVPLSENDPLRKALRDSKKKDDVLSIPRTVADASTVAAQGSATHQNQVTAWWDLSQIYGSNIETQQKLREFSGGRMKLRKVTLADGTVEERLPLDPTTDRGRGSEKYQKELTGFNKNWWPGISLLHHVFVLEHNRIAAELHRYYPKMTDEELFQTARLVNSAVQAKIHTVEWTPAILSSLVMYRAMNGNWYGFGRDSGNVRSFGEKLLGLAFDFKGNMGVKGAVGEAPKFHGVPFSHTEEFVSIYRLHPLMPDHLAILNRNTEEVKETKLLTELREEGSHALTDRYSLTDMLYSLGRQHPGLLIANNFPNFMTEMKIQEPTISYITDLAMTDIVRDRERGVLRYNDLREMLGLSRLDSFDYFVNSAESVPLVEKLKEIYNNDINKVDVLVGTLAEGFRPEGFGFAETLFQVFLVTATRRLETDRFLTTDFTPEVYTPVGYKWVNDRTMKGILIDNIPGLSNDLAAIKNPFRPWRPHNGRAVAADDPMKLAYESNEVQWTDFTHPNKSTRKPAQAMPVISCKEAPLNSEYSNNAAKEAENYALMGVRMSMVMKEYAKKDLKGNFNADTLAHGDGGNTLPEGGDRRPFHAKAHACLKARFQILDDLNAGVFRSSNEYKAWVRFSNASGEMKPDGDDDLRGVAIKLLGIKNNVKNAQFLQDDPNDQSSRTQDFLLTNYPVHFVKDSAEMVSFAEGVSKLPNGKLGKLFYFLPFHMKLLGKAKAAQSQTKPPENSMAETDYYSRVPFLLGDKAAKFVLKPCEGTTKSTEATKNKAPNFLRTDIIDRAEKGFCYDFYVQYQQPDSAYTSDAKVKLENGYDYSQHACVDDIEDPRKAWKGGLRRVARLTFKPEDNEGFVNTARRNGYNPTKQDEFCEDMRFNPWHGLTDIRPIGDMNRARERVYYAVQNARRAPKGYDSKPIEW